MIEYHSRDGKKVLFESIDGTVTRKLSAAYAADCKALCEQVADKLLPKTTLDHVFQKLAKKLITPGRLKREYRKIYKAAKLREAALAQEENISAKDEDLPF